MNGQSGCYAPQPNSRAAYNRTYTVLGRSYTPLRSAAGYEAEGAASWYGWESGSTTSMGDRFNPRAFTAASRTLPLPTCVQVTNLANGRSALVLVNDRGPFVDSRIMDLSYGAAQALGITRTGTAQVRIVALSDNASPATPAPATGAPIEAFTPSRKASPAIASASLPEQFTPVPLPAPATVPQLAQASDLNSPGIVVQSLPPMQASATTGNMQTQAPVTPQRVLTSVASSAASSPATSESTQAPSALQSGTNPAQAALPATAPLGVTPQMPGTPQTYVQTGAFTVQANAKAERARLMASGIGPVDVVPDYLHGSVIYRVQIGPLPSGQPDAQLQDRIRSLGLNSYTLVQQ